MNALTQDFKSQYVAKGVQGGTLVAAGAGDNTEVTSAAIDRLGYDSVDLVIAGQTTCAVGQTLKFTTKIAESDDGTTFGADTTIDNAVTVDAGAAASHSFAYRSPMSIKPRKRYYRIKLTPDLSAGSVDTAQWGCSAIHAGADVLPAA